MILDAKRFTIAGTGTLVAEHSDLGIGRQPPPRQFTLINFPEEGRHRSFTFSHTDGSGGDVVGWNYLECGWLTENQGARVLIIND